MALRGYSTKDLDAFLRRVEKSLRDWEARRPGDVTARDVERQTFRVTLRGYSDGEVDHYLDDLIATLKTYEQRSTTAEAADGEPQQSRHLPNRDQSQHHERGGP